MKNKKHITNEVSPETKHSLKVRVITAIVGMAIFFPCLFVGGWLFFALIIFLTAVGGFELVHCAKRKYNPTLYIVAILLVVLFATFPIFVELIHVTMGAENTFQTFPIYAGFDKLYVSASVVVIGLILCFSMVLIDPNFEIRDAAYLFAFGVLLGLGMQSFLYLRYYPVLEHYGSAFAGEKDVFFDYCSSASLIILIWGGSLMSDTGAYFAGILFGKHKMNERISPKKTWEGFAGGIVLSMIYTLTFGYSMAAAGYPIIEIFGLNNWYYLFILSIIIPIVSPLGDFIFSSVKRYYKIKDFGNLMPGHGGVLDRFDSVIFASVVSSILIILFTSITNGAWGNVLI